MADFKGPTEIRRELVALIEALENEGMDLARNDENGRASDLFAIRKRIIGATYKTEV